jgi:aspartate/methionine/tyrosine aminotransferase
VNPAPPELDGAYGRFRLDRYFRRRAFGGAVLQLGASDCEPMQVGELLALEPTLATQLAALPLTYPPYEGMPVLREAVAAACYRGCDPDQVLVTSGAEEAIFLAMHVLVNRGDHVVVQAPCYQSLYSLACSRGATVSLWQPTEGQAWDYDVGALGRLLSTPTRLLVLNSPNNPTGFAFDATAWQRVLALAESHGCWVLSDEVYRGLELPPAATLPAAWQCAERALSVGDCSKTLGLPGLRIGWLASRNTALLECIEAQKDFTTIAAAGPSQLLAAAALRHAQPLVQAQLARVRQNQALLEDWLQRWSGAFRMARAHAGTTRFVRWLGQSDGSTLCERLLADTRVMLIPGQLFDADPQLVRLGLGRACVPQALASLSRWLESQPGLVR